MKKNLLKYIISVVHTQQYQLDHTCTAVSHFCTCTKQTRRSQDFKDNIMMMLVINIHLKSTLLYQVLTNQFVYIAIKKKLRTTD